MANLTKKEIIERGYLTDVAIANSDLGVDDPKFKAAITNSFYYDMIYGRDTSHKVEEVMTIQEPTIDVEDVVNPVKDVVEKVVEPQGVIETSTESVLLEEDLKEENEEPAVEVPSEEPVVETVEEVVETVVEEPVVDECPLYEEAPVVEEPVVEEVVEDVVDPVEPEATVEEIEDETTEE